MAELHEKIGDMRNALGITQTQLAKQLGVTRSAVNLWEMGISKPQLKHVIQMANIFNTTVDGLIGCDSKTILDITELSEREKELVINLVDCLKKK